MADPTPPHATAPRALWLYHWLAGFKSLSYRLKIMVMAFLGTHVPLITLACWFAFESSHDTRTLLVTLGITLVATLVGTGITLYVLNQLLQPVLLTSDALRSYRETRQRKPLPKGYTDEVGTLMADAGTTLDHLDGLITTLEYNDEATGLPNRKRFLQQVAARLALGHPFAVVVLRFGNLPRIADTLDHAQANIAARWMAERLATRPELGDHLARIDTMHFACMVGARRGDGAPWVDAAARMHVAIEACAHDIRLDGLEIQPALFGGLATYPEDGADAALLVDRALAAASQATTASPVTLHSERARTAAVHRLRLEQELRRAIDRDEFELHFQPVVDVSVGRAVGAEALIRWRHPQRGLVAPGEFIPAAEASGLIQPIGLWVLRSACAQVRDWNAAGHRDLRMAINLSARQFMDPDLQRHVLEAITHSGIAPNQLEIELTETDAMVDHEYTRRVFTGLRDAGVGIAIDDFGTGYASMSYLRKLPFDKLKIDREFVTAVHNTPHNQAICGALIALSRGLNLRVLAEGAETKEEVHYLAGQGCEMFQGFYFSRPLPRDEFQRAMQMPAQFVLSTI